MESLIKVLVLFKILNPLPFLEYATVFKMLTSLVLFKRTVSALFSNEKPLILVPRPLGVTVNTGSTPFPTSRVLLVLIMFNGLLIVKLAPAILA